MPIMKYARLAAMVTLLAMSPDLLVAQTSGYRVDPSGRANTIVLLNKSQAGTPPAARPRPLQIGIDYGQPHLRGRDVATLIPAGQVWRLGANIVTTLSNDLDIVLGGTTVPKGSYSLFLVRNDTGSQLIINRQTGQNGTQYDPTRDLARVSVRSRKTGSSLESLQIALVPATNGPSGILRMTWGNLEFETDWSVKQ